MLSSNFSHRGKWESVSECLAFAALQDNAKKAYIFLVPPKILRQANWLGGTKGLGEQEPELRTKCIKGMLILNRYFEDTIGKPAYEQLGIPPRVSPILLNGCTQWFISFTLPLLHPVARSLLMTLRAANINLCWWIVSTYRMPAQLCDFGGEITQIWAIKSSFKKINC